jgi:signal transduction histidine kinase
MPTVIVEGEKHMLRYANGAFLEHVGAPGEPPLGRSLDEIFPEFVEGVRAVLDRADRASVAPPPDTDDRSANPPRETCPGPWTAWRLNGAEMPPGLLCLQRQDAPERAADLSQEIRQINERLVVAAVREHELLSNERAALLETAQEAIRAKASFLAVISHELRTPLNAVLGYTELLAAEITGPLNPNQKKQLGRIDAGTKRFVGLVEEILLFSRLEAGREEVYLTRVDAFELAQDVVALIAPLVQQAGLSLSINPPERPIFIRTDAAKVRRILLNVLGNAAKYTDAGEVRLDVREIGADVVFAVADTGVGIPTEHLENIFEPFRQVGQVLTRRKGGTGLGLSVCRRLARLLGGDVVAESTPGKGSVFTLRLPMETRARLRSGERH